MPRYWIRLQFGPYEGDDPEGAVDALRQNLTEKSRLALRRLAQDGCVLEVTSIDYLPFTERPFAESEPSR